MKKIITLVIIAAFLVCGISSVSFAWCWIRDTGLTDENCESQYQQECCSGFLRTWKENGMTYQISTETDPALLDSIREGFQTWNDVEMSTFTFTEGAQTDEILFQQDGINLVHADDAFCRTYLGNCGMGLAGFSGTWTEGERGYYHAVESDIILNTQENPLNPGMNAVSLIAHESGHNLGLSHTGATCRRAASAGCGPHFGHGTMNFIVQNYRLATLELDDVAGLIYGYPRCRDFRVRVTDSTGWPIRGAEVLLLDTAAPVNGESIDEGGMVVGDVTNPDVLFGEGEASDTYYDMTPFRTTDLGGWTNPITPIHRTFRIVASYEGDSTEQEVTVDNDYHNLFVTLNNIVVHPEDDDDDGGICFVNP